MEVRTQRTTTKGEEAVEREVGDTLVCPPGARPSLSGTTLLGTVTDVTDIGGGVIEFEADGEYRTLGEVTAVRMPPMVDKLRVEFEAIPSQTFSGATLIGITHD